MNKSSTCKFVLVIIAIIALLSSGCINQGLILPNEINNRGHIISVDSETIEPSIVVQLLFEPENYEKLFFETLDVYLPENQSIVEVGMGLGVVSSYLSERLSGKDKRTLEQIGIEPNPHLIPLLNETKKRNDLSFTIIQKAVGYAPDNKGYLEIYPNLQKTELTSTPQLNCEEVKLTTIEEIIESSIIPDKKNVTLIIDVKDLANNIFSQEKRRLSDYVNRIIINTNDYTTGEVSKLDNLANNAGYFEVYESLGGKDGEKVFVYDRYTNILSNT